MVAVCAAAMWHLAACCVEPRDSIKRHGEPDIVYELRGATGRWYWYRKGAPAPLMRPDQIGFIWLDQDHQAVFTGDCRTYDGPVRSDEWRRFEQARLQDLERDAQPELEPEHGEPLP